MDKKNINPFGGFGTAALYGEINDLIVYLALIPDEERMVKMWERALVGRAADYRHKTAVYDFSDDKPTRREARKKVGSAGEKLIGEADEVRKTLGIEVSEDFSNEWKGIFAEGGYDPYLERAFLGEDQKVGEGRFGKLSPDQADYLFGELVSEKVVFGTAFKYIKSNKEADRKNFIDLFSGRGISDKYFERFTWVGGRQSLIHLLAEYKSKSWASCEEMPEVASYFFKNTKGNPWDIGRPKKQVSSSRDKREVDELVVIFEKIETLG